jgi:hypothetical protein
VIAGPKRDFAAGVQDHLAVAPDRRRRDGKARAQRQKARPTCFFLADPAPVFPKWPTDARSAAIFRVSR